MTARYKLWHGKGTRSLRVLWTLEELNIRDDVELQVSNFPPRLRHPEYLSINPLGTLPYFTDGKVTITESVAACLYICAEQAERMLTISPGEPDYGSFLQFCFFGEASMMPPLGTLVGQLLFQAPEDRSEMAISSARDLFTARLEPLSQALRSNAFLAAGRFTLADVSVGYALTLAKLLGEQAMLTPDVAAYLDRLSERPAYQRASAA